MKLLTKEHVRRLRSNGQQNSREEGHLDLQPVVKLFTPDAQCTWLLSEIDPEDPDRAFGLCDLGQGYPELGWVRLTDIRGIRGQFGLGVERDRSFCPDRSLSEYANEARQARRIKA